MYHVSCVLLMYNVSCLNPYSCCAFLLVYHVSCVLLMYNVSCLNPYSCCAFLLVYHVSCVLLMYNVSCLNPYSCCAFLLMYHSAVDAPRVSYLCKLLTHVNKTSLYISTVNSCTAKSVYYHSISEYQTPASVKTFFYHTVYLTQLTHNTSLY